MDDTLITTVTPNPASDKAYFINGFAAGKLNRVYGMRIDAGGKAIDIARQLKGLGKPVLVLNFFGGPAGDEFLSILGQADIKAQPTLVPGNIQLTPKSSTMNWDSEQKSMNLAPQ